MLVTKWKTYSRKGIAKLTAFILIIICFLIGTSSALNIYLNVEYFESITVKSYMESNTLSNELRYAANRLEHVMKVYKGEGYILSGKTVRNLDIEDSWQLTNLYNNFMVEKGSEDSNELRNLFWIEKNKEIEEIKKAIMKTDLTNYEQIINELNNPSGLIYYATDGIYECTNTNNPNRDYYLQFNVYITIDKLGMKLEPENGYNDYSSSLLDTFEDIEDGRKQFAIYAAITEEGLLNRVEKWNEDRLILIKNAIIIVMCVVLALLSLVYLLVVTGKVTEDEEVHMLAFDKLYSDINISLIAGMFILSYYQFYNVLNIRYTSENLMRFIMTSLVVVVISLFLILLFSIARHIKNKTIIKHSMIYSILSYFAKVVVRIVASGPLMYKSMIAVVGLILISYYSSRVPKIIIPVIVVSLYYIYIKVKRFQIIQEGLKNVITGDYNYKIDFEGNGEFKQLAEDINSMTSGLKEAVQSEIKSERLKTELITNVSHDIKTPLTSIISYVDLLKREGLSSPNASKYLDVLDRKSNRLKTLTEDLFEAAKATSGSIEPEFEKVNVNALMAQVLGELDEKISESKLTFKVTSEKDKVIAKADGRLLSRVMENLLSNIFKYALKESRVYINIYETEKEVIISFKNISAYELNMPVDELMERFKRGDESRSSEGNGLGLAIARSLMEIQEGSLELSIDGDLFKAEIKLSKYF